MSLGTDLSILHIYITNNTYHGILRFAITKHFHNLVINLKVFTINTNDPKMIEVFASNLKSDPNNRNIIDIIPTNQVLDHNFQLFDCEEVLNGLNGLNNYNLINDIYKVQIGSVVKCSLNKMQYDRIYNFFNSFIVNFAMLDAIYNIYLNILDAGRSTLIPKEEIKEPICSIPTEEVPTPDFSNTIKTTETPESGGLKQETIYETILNFSLTSSLKSYLINNIFSYYQYLILIKDTFKISKKDDNKVTLTIPMLFSPTVLLNTGYTFSVFNSLIFIKDLDPQVFNFNLKKIFDNLNNLILENDFLENPDKKLQVLLLLFIFYSYHYKLIISKYQQVTIDRFVNPIFQQNALNHYLTAYDDWAARFDIIVNTEIQEVVDVANEETDEKTLKEISEKFDHLKPVSQKDFLDIVISEFENRENKSPLYQIQNFQFSYPKIINIEQIIFNAKIKNKLKDKKNRYITVEDLEETKSYLLEYTDSNPISSLYKCLLEFNTSPESVRLLKTIPKPVLNLFDFLSKSLPKLFNKQTINNSYSNYSTFTFYKILFENLPASEKHQHETYLHIIFQIVIPYLYHNDKIIEFEDVFL